MKKLMTLLSAAAVAFGLQAADTGTSFEGMTPGNLDITSSTGELVAETSGYWVTNGNEKVSLKVVQGVSVDRDQWYSEDEALFPNNQYRYADQQRYLEIKTPFGNPVSRKINSNGGEETMVGGFYFDSLVKFTAFDEDPLTMAVTNDFNGAKIAVWTQEVKSEQDPDEVVGTNLYVRAGYVGGTPKTYDCGRFAAPESWHRLTIKAVPSIYKTGNAIPGFIVFVDNQCCSAFRQDTGIEESLLNSLYEGFYSLEALFPSMDQDPESEQKDYISSVSFDGQGSVDDIAFTRTRPFSAAKESEFVYVSWDADDVTAVSIDGVAQTVADEGAKLTYTGSFTPAISVTYAEGKLAGTWTGTATISGSSVTFEAAGQTCEIVAANAAASFNGVPRATLAAAVAAANAAETLLGADYTLKLFDLTGEESTTVAINNQNGVVITIDLNGQTIEAIEADSAVIIVDSSDEKTGTVEGYTPLASGSEIRAGTFNDEVVADGISVSDGRFKVPQDKTTEEYLEYLNAWSKPEGKEFVEGTGDDTGYLVLGNEAVKYTIKFISGEGSTTNEYKIAAGDAVDAPKPADVAGKGFSAWNPAVVSPAAADATYTAQYTNNQYTITYKNADGTAFTSWAQDYDAPTSFTIAIVETLPIAENVTLALGATFEGWTNALGTVVANTQGLTADLVVFAKLGASGSGGWAVEPDENKTAAQQYPALAGSALATANAKVLTDWATDKGLSIAAVADAAEDSDIYDAYLLNCDVEDVEAERAAFVPSITIVDGEVTVTAPEGEFNGTLKKYGSADLETWTEANTNEGYNFFKYELVP